MNKLLLPFLLFTFPLVSWGFNKDFTVISEKIPYEFSVMFNSMKDQTKNINDQIKLVGFAEDLNRNLGFLEKEHIFFLMKSEVSKSVLEYRFEKTREFGITNHLILKLENKLNANERYLTDFSKWIWRAIVAELKYRQKMGLITDGPFNPELFRDDKKIQAVRFKKYLHYLMPWIDQMDNLDHQGFNLLAQKVAWEILRKLNDRSLLFKNMSYAQADVQTILFNIPAKLQNLTPDKVKELQFLQDTKTLKEESQESKTEAKEKMDQLSPDDLSPLSDEISKKIQNQEP